MLLLPLPTTILPELEIEIKFILLYYLLIII